MKIRLEGTKEEIEQAISRFNFNYTPMGNPILNIKSISKFYPNRNTAERMLNIKSDIGRVYIEVE